MEPIAVRERKISTRVIKSPSFLDLEDGELRELSKSATLKAFPRNNIIISEGERTDSVYVIHSGKVKMSLHGKNGKEISIGVMGPGEFFGEMALDGGPRSATVRTLEPALLFVIPKWVFTEFVIRHPEFALRLVRTLIFRMRGLLNNVRGLASLDVYGRVAHLLLELATEENGKLVIKGRLTRQDIADRVGASRESVSRIFKTLVLGGYVKLEKKSITIAKRLPEGW